MSTMSNFLPVARDADFFPSRLQAPTDGMVPDNLSRHDFEGCWRCAVVFAKALREKVEICLYLHSNRDASSGRISSKLHSPDNPSP
jgi:hypothetical protein